MYQKSIKYLTIYYHHPRLASLCHKLCGVPQPKLRICENASSQQKYIITLIYCSPSGHYCWTRDRRKLKYLFPKRILPLDKGLKKTKVQDKNPLSLIHSTNLSSQKLCIRLNCVFTSTRCPATLWQAGHSFTGPLHMHYVCKRGPGVADGCLSPSFTL